MLDGKVMENNTVVKTLECGNKFAHNAENHNKESVVSESNKADHIFYNYEARKESEKYTCICIQTSSKIKRKEPIRSLSVCEGNEYNIHE